MASVAENECSHREQSWQWQEIGFVALLMAMARWLVYLDDFRLAFDHTCGGRSCHGDEKVILQ
jgi:hypothetical protein